MNPIPKVTVSEGLILRKVSTFNPGALALVAASNDRDGWNWEGGGFVERKALNRLLTKRLITLKDYIASEYGTREVVWERLASEKVDDWAGRLWSVALTDLGKATLVVYETTYAPGGRRAG